MQQPGCHLMEVWETDADKLLSVSPEDASNRFELQHGRMRSDKKILPMGMGTPRERSPKDVVKPPPRGLSGQFIK